MRGKRVKWIRKQLDDMEIAGSRLMRVVYTNTIIWQGRRRAYKEMKKSWNRKEGVKYVSK